MLVCFYFSEGRIQVFHCEQLTSPKLSVQQAQNVTLFLRSKKMEYLKSTQRCSAQRRGLSITGLSPFPLPLISSPIRTECGRCKGVDVRTH